MVRGYSSNIALPLALEDLVILILHFHIDRLLGCAGPSTFFLDLCRFNTPLMATNAPALLICAAGLPAPIIGRMRPLARHACRQLPQVFSVGRQLLLVLLEDLWLLLFSHDDTRLSLPVHLLFPLNFGLPPANRCFLILSLENSWLSFTLLR